MIFACVFCGKENNKHGTKHKFCNNICKINYYWENVTKNKIRNGLVSTNTHAIRKYLKETNGDRCSDCGLQSVWNGKPLVLQVDHIDGNTDNNYPENLRLLCPNCHTQTETFTKRKKKSSCRSHYMVLYRNNLKNKDV